MQTTKRVMHNIQRKARKHTRQARKLKERAQTNGQPRVGITKKV